MTITELRERKRTLAAAALRLAEPIAETHCELHKAHLTEVQSLLYDLWAEASDELEMALSDAPRQAAEARLAYHTDTDTLDLY